jgi:UDP-N-acetylglucosamine 1-carboxyvinyltransferase
VDSFLVSNSGVLVGNAKVSGAKNAVLPIMAAALLVKGKSRIGNVPNLRDVRTMSDLLRVIGAKVKFEGEELLVDATDCDHLEAPYELVKTMRASFYVMGPLLARFGKVRVSLPGGCAWGPRPVDLHIKSMEALGAKISFEHGYVVAEAPEGGLVGCDYDFPLSTVGATGNMLMAATLAKGTTRIGNAAMEPEIDSLCEFLISMGARIQGVGTRELVIEGVPALVGGDVDTIPDRIEAGTLLCVAAITRGRVKTENVEPKHLKAVINSLIEMGVKIEQGDDWVISDAKGCELKPIDVETTPYPGFPTDMQAQMTALMMTVEGRSMVTDTIYTDRFMHISELQRLGADIVMKENTAVVRGGAKLSAAPVMSSDLRASAAMVLGGLVAEGTTEISRVYHLDRGYDKFEDKLVGLGAKVERIRGN